MDFGKWKILSKESSGYVFGKRPSISYFAQKRICCKPFYLQFSGIGKDSDGLIFSRSFKNP
jgi:hypothetical protein